MPPRSRRKIDTSLELMERHVDVCELVAEIR